MAKKKRVTVTLAPAKSKKKTNKQKERNEVTRLGYALRALGGMGGGTLGGYMGHPEVGLAMGTQLGATISKWLGSGAYSVSANSLTRLSPNGTVPMMHNTSQSITVRHKEFIGDILSSTTFAVQNTLDINPGNVRLFPWLATLAQQYEEYRIKGMVFHYVPTSGMAISGTNAAVGNVMIQTSYRASTIAPADKAEMLNEYWATDARASEAFCHPIECDPKENPFNVHYVRTGTLPPTDSILMYDYGRTFVATSGNPANGNILGELWVSYEVELKKPVVAKTLTTQSFSAQATAGINASTPFGTSWLTTNSSMWLPVTTSSSGVVTFPPGSYGSWQITFWGSNGGSNTYGIPVVTNATIINCFGPNFSKQTSNTVVSDVVATVTITIASNAVSTVTFPVTVMNSTRVGLLITEVNPTVAF
nr:structural protein [Tolivirales sp.]